MNGAELEAQVAALAAGDVRTAARLISRVERGDDTLVPLLQALYRRGGHAQVIGVTGPPGAGKQHGESLAIIGTTGSGKSTVSNLIARLYDAREGEVLVDDTPIEHYSLHPLRTQIGYVPQDVFLFSDTIHNNIAFGLTDSHTEKVIVAAKDADVYDNIMAFPQGFETRIGERGITLSGGQKQRVSIARAIVREPRILILDDALSAVDTKTEINILNSMKRIMENRTSVIISHRVSSVKLANKILVLMDGQIVEEGTHIGLIRKGGVYKDLYRKQIETEKESALENVTLAYSTGSDNVTLTLVW